MSSREHCVETLRGFIERADRAELAQAQAAIIAYALGAPDLPARSQAMADLQADLAEAVKAEEPESMQFAYYSVIDAMIDRTREAVVERKLA